MGVAHHRSVTVRMEVLEKGGVVITKPDVAVWFFMFKNRVH